MKTAAVLLLAAFLLARPLAAEEPVTVFGAASLTDALEAAGAAWREQGGEEVRFSFASSSTLARQIEAGAPGDIYVSANETWMDYLAERDLIDEASRVSPIGNGLVLIAPADSGAAEVDLAATPDLTARLGPEGRLAMGDPEHVPAGIYGRQALESLGLWEALAPRLARADNVRAALALVASGEAPLGIVYATDAKIDAGVTVIGRFPATSHRPITYPFALLPEAGAAARDFFAFLTSDAGLSILEGFGFHRTRE